MNTIYVSGTLNNPAQIKMGDHGYLVTFDLTHLEKNRDVQGNLNEVKTEWSVSMQYDQDPSELIKKLEKGRKVLVKGDAKIKHTEVNNEFILDCYLQAETLDLMGHSLKERLEQNKTLTTTEDQGVKTIAS